MRAGRIVLIATVFCGCSSRSNPHFEDVDLEMATFECYEWKGTFSTAKWSDFSQQDQVQLQEYLFRTPLEGSMSFVSYAPKVIIRTQNLIVNFTGGHVVCNYNSASGWKQTARKMTEYDNKVLQCITNTILSNAVSGNLEEVR